MSDVKGIKTECQIKRDTAYKNTMLKLLYHNKIFARPTGIQAYLNKEAKRLCLKCDKPFTSLSLHNRICERCKRLQFNTINFYNITLETTSLLEFLNPYK